MAPLRQIPLTEGGLVGRQGERDICGSGTRRFLGGRYGIGWRRDGRTSGCGRRTRVIPFGNGDRWLVPNVSRLVSVVCPVSEVGCTRVSSDGLKRRADKGSWLS